MNGLLFAWFLVGLWALNATVAWIGWHAQSRRLEETRGRIRELAERAVQLRRIVLDLGGFLPPEEGVADAVDADGVDDEPVPDPL